jgi:hypothetical protein
MVAPTCFYSKTIIMHIYCANNILLLICDIHNIRSIRLYICTTYGGSILGSKYIRVSCNIKK